jgi:hypothetical protein
MLMLSGAPSAVTQILIGSVGGNELEEAAESGVETAGDYSNVSWERAVDGPQNRQLTVLGRRAVPESNTGRGPLPFPQG